MDDAGKLPVRSSESSYKVDFFTVSFPNGGLLFKSHNFLAPYPTMHQFATEMCTCVHCGISV